MSHPIIVLGYGTSPVFRLVRVAADLASHQMKSAATASAD